eukprot:6469348-Prymnesium_polylepis.1
MGKGQLAMRVAIDTQPLCAQLRTAVATNDSPAQPRRSTQLHRVEVTRKHETPWHLLLVQHGMNHLDPDAELILARFLCIEQGATANGCRQHA